MLLGMVVAHHSGGFIKNGSGKERHHDSGKEKAERKSADYAHHTYHQHHEETNGQDGAQVTAVPDSGYVFSQWSDGVLTAARQDLGITGAITVTAQFVSE